RPEYAEMLWGIRFAYPALFMINRLVGAKAIDVDTAVKWAEYDRYGPEVTTPLRKYWTQLAASAGASAAAKQDPAIKSAQTKFLTALHTAYVGGATNDTDALAWLADAGVSADTATAIIDFWRLEYQLEQGAPPPAA